MVKLHLNGYKFGVGVGQVNYFRLFRKFSKIRRVYKVGKGVYFNWLEERVGAELVLLAKFG